MHLKQAIIFLGKPYSNCFLNKLSKKLFHAVIFQLIDRKNLIFQKHANNICQNVKDAISRLI